MPRWATRCSSRPPTCDSKGGRSRWQRSEPPENRARPSPREPPETRARPSCHDVRARPGAHEGAHDVTRATRRVVLLAALTAALAGLVVGPASAHDELIATDPAVEATVEQAPTSVTPVSYT